MRNSGLSGIAGGEMGELYQALSQMREERESFVDQKNAAKNEKTKREEEKEMLGKKVVEMALLRKAQGSSEEVSDEGDNGSSEGDGSGSSGKKRRKRAKVERVDLTSGLALFAEKLKEADMARVKLDTDVFEFEKHKHELEIAELEKDRVERREERADSNKLELEKFKLMMDVFRSQNQ